MFGKVDCQSKHHSAAQFDQRGHGVSLRTATGVSLWGGLVWRSLGDPWTLSRVGDR